MHTCSVSFVDRSYLSTSTAPGQHTVSALTPQAPRAPPLGSRGPWPFSPDPYSSPIDPGGQSTLALASSSIHDDIQRRLKGWLAGCTRASPARLISQKPIPLTRTAARPCCSAN